MQTWAVNNKQGMHGASAREGAAPRRHHICLLWAIGCSYTVLSLLFGDPAVGANKPRELLADWFPCFNSYLTWQSLAPSCFQIEILYRNEKNHHTQQWINNSCQLAARAIIFTMLPDSVLIAREREFVLKLLIFKLHVKTTNCMACLSNKA